MSIRVQFESALDILINGALRSANARETDQQILRDIIEVLQEAADDWAANLAGPARGKIEGA
jgi:hypothetical protein